MTGNGKSIRYNYDGKMIITIDDKTLGTILNCAVRNIVGSSSNEALTIVDYVNNLLPYLNDDTLYAFKQDYEEDSEIRKLSYLYFSEACESVWLNFYKNVCEELSKREYKTS